MGYYHWFTIEMSVNIISSSVNLIRRIKFDYWTTYVFKMIIIYWSCCLFINVIEYIYDF